MRKIIGAAVAALSLWACAGAMAVVGGRPIDPGAGDHVVALLDASKPDTRDAQYCDGTLVDAQWVLTAGHCAVGVRPDALQVAVGQRLLSAVGPADRYAVDAIAMYPLYDARRWGHDLALVHLARPVPAGVTPAPEQYQHGPATSYGGRGWVSGWGATQQAPTGSDELLTGLISISTPAQCRALGAPWGTICGTMPFTAEAAACWGDSGGPLESRGQLVGVVSFGPQGCDNSSPTAYTHVGTYSPWIDWVRGGGDPRVSLPEVTSITARRLGRSGVIRLQMRWCQSGAIGHRVFTRFRVAHGANRWQYTPGAWRAMRGRCGGYSVRHVMSRRPGGTMTALAEVRDQDTGMRYWSTYPTRLRIS